MREVLSILDLIAGSDDLHLVSAAKLRRLCGELEKFPCQILVGRRAADKAEQVEIFITYSPKPEEGEI